MDNTRKAQELAGRCSYLGLPVGLLFALLMGFPFPVGAQGNPPISSALQMCIVYEVEGLGCALSGQGPACWDRALAQYDACVIRAQTLPPAPPPPAVTPTPRPLNRCPPQFYGEGSRIATNFCVVLIDPVPDLVNQAGTGVVTDKERLATAGISVSGVAADGAARLVIRIYANFEGERLKLLLQPDGGKNPNSLPEPDGVLATAGGTPSGYQLQVTAVNTSKGPVASAMYFPPKDFSRGGDDDNAGSRSVSLQVTSLDTPSSSSNVNMTIVRPPVILVHGLWGHREDWNNFTPLNSDARFPIVAKADYSSLLVPVANSDPSYDFPIIAESSALGFALNASPNVSLVLSDIDKAAKVFRKKTNAAGVQVDVVAHSMGGLVTRTLEYHPAYADRSSFSVGEIHKLITIGTPHLGSPLATKLLQADPPEATNPCIRKVLAQKDSPAFRTVTLDDPGGSTLNGGVGDLQGDGTGANLSQALTFIKNTPNGHEAPTALISGTMTEKNTTGLTSYWKRQGVGLFLNDYACRGSNEPLIRALAAGNWSSVFGGAASDAVVPYTSQVNSGLGRSFPGLIHSAGMKKLGFAGPTELDSDAQTGIPSYVIQLLNAPSNSDAFRLLSH